MCSMSVLCPLCAQTSFSSIDALRCSLIKAANGPLACPICSELFLGLDKLTIHLFSHTNIMINTANNVNATTTPTIHNQNIKENIEKFKTQQIENPNNSSNCNNCNDNNKITKTHSNGELNFDNIHHHLQENNMMNKPKEANNKKDTTAIVNKSNTNQQHEHQQVATTAGEDHKELRETATLAQCDICEFTFRNEELRNMHIRLVHQNIECHNNANDSFEGNKTLTSTTTSPVHDCRNAQINHEFKCHLCAKTFKTKGSLRIHLKVVHLMGLPYVNNTPKLTICDRIRHKENKIFKSANPTPNNTQLQRQPTTLEYESSNNCNLFNISPINFISNINTIPPPTASNISVVNLNQPLEYPQNNLDKSTIQNSNVLLVFNTSGTAEKETTLNSITNNDNSKATALIISKENDVAFRFNSYMANVTENPKIWECDVCSKAFTTKYFLKKHKRLHTGEMPYTCELCARTFTFQQSYHKHLLYHSDEKPHVCSTCGRAFKELSTLHNHERIHSGEKPFKCDVCGKSFRQRVSFLVHSRIHTGVMPYKCEMCKRSFRYKVSQRTHKCQSLSTEDAATTPQDESSNDNMSHSFMKAFLETSAANEADQPQLNQSQSSPASNEIAFINDKATSSLNEQEALLAKTIDDIVVESCNRLGIGSDGLTQQQMINEGSMSPSQKLQNMRLYSPQLVTPDLNGIEGDLTKFFLVNSPTGNNLM